MVSVIIPVYNGAKQSGPIFSILKKCPGINEIIVIDSGSTDSSIKIAESFGARVIKIENHLFDHGGTRTLGGKAASGDILVYMTQDALPVNEYSIEKLIKPLLENKEIGASYGRQLPYPDATAFAAHLRAFNYPPVSCIKSLKDKERLGIKAPFLSNSFSAYRMDALEKIGWFKCGLIIAEDTYAGAKLLLAGYKIAYVADATVYHSHNYTILQEFKRYFDIGVFHKNESWIINEFGFAEGEGMKYVKSEITSLIKNKKIHLMPEFIIRNCFKFLGYKIGRNYKKLPVNIIKKISMHSAWWDKPKGL